MNRKLSGTVGANDVIQQENNQLFKHPIFSVYGSKAYINIKRFENMYKFLKIIISSWYHTFKKVYIFITKIFI